VRPIADAIRAILTGYGDAYSHGRFCATHPISAPFDRLRATLAETLPVATYRPTLKLDYSFGVGRWARVPWLALLDPRSASSIGEGVFIALLFRADLAGVFLALTQGTRDFDLPRQATHKRTARLRVQGASLAAHGFHVDDGMDLASDGRLAKRYEEVTAAYKLYRLDGLPSDTMIVGDLDAALTVYKSLPNHF
jgi:hypothetical protein